MLNKGLRDEQSIKIDNMLRMLYSLVFVPKFWNIEDTSILDNQLTGFDLTIENLKDLNDNDLIAHLGRYHLDWKQFEQFADVLVLLSQEKQFDFLQKAVAIYNYIQQQSKTFSFDIFNKIAAAKEKL
ncbi:MAG TPA: hypothetical protein VIH09_08780 [Flavobacterium sp.]|uniref:hypothetical protein n=1 Tax=Flavobacterium sp. TaxID=239 RepID=UPI002F42FFD2